MNRHRAVIVSYIPKCSFCDEPGVYDCKIPASGWADLCEAHFLQFGCGLGLGRGQKRILRSELPGNPEVTFEVWMRKVDAALVGQVGLSSSDLPDQAYYDYYESGTEPREVAKEIVEEEMGGLLG